ncbi:MAG: ABC transporter ATP-binding protein [Alphaproteobacteria bacterium]|nr:ABC transporter ATP-binding protein [Alphaproteobacteria bacterium]
MSRDKDIGDLIIRTEKVSRVLEDQEFPVTLVRDISIQVKRGEFVAITGPSGSGKSSLLYLLGLLDAPTDGRIFIGKQDTGLLSDKQLAQFRLENIGFVFQFHFLLWEFSVLRNVMLPMMKLQKFKGEEIEDRAVMLLTELGLEAHMFKTPDQLSGGQRQRVAVARALANAPILMLGDEPTGNLDTKSTANVISILKDLVREHKNTIVVVTHDTDFAKQVDRQIHIVDGQVV